MSTLVPLGYMGIVFFLSSIPGVSKAGKVLPGVDQNLLHIPCYALLTLLWILSLRTRGVSHYVTLWAAFALTSSYGALTELYQFTVPGRFPSFSDFLFDVSGVLVCIALYEQLRKKYPFSTR